MFYGDWRIRGSDISPIWDNLHPDFKWMDLEKYTSERSFSGLPIGKREDILAHLDAGGVIDEYGNLL